MAGRSRKSLNTLEKEFKNAFGKQDNCVYLVDTGAIIDIQRVVEQYFMPCKKTQIAESLERFEEYGTPLITNRTYEEIKAHSKILRNSHRQEISAAGLGKATLYHENLETSLRGLRSSENEPIFLDSYLRVQNHIRPLLTLDNGDCPSETDLEILVFATTLAEAPIIGSEYKRMVGILTSDGGHVGSGGRILGEVYPNIKVFDTRN